jgi:hypothetical protein
MSASTLSGAPSGSSSSSAARVPAASIRSMSACRWRPSGPRPVLRRLAPDSASNRGEVVEVRDYISLLGRCTRRLPRTRVHGQRPVANGHLEHGANDDLGLALAVPHSARKSASTTSIRRARIAAGTAGNKGVNIRPEAANARRLGSAGRSCAWVRCGRTSLPRETETWTGRRRSICPCLPGIGEQRWNCQVGPPTRRRVPQAHHGQ